MTSRKAFFPEGVLAGVLCAPLKLLFALALGMVAMLLVGWAIEGVFVCKIWPAGAARLRVVFAAELGRGSELATRQGGAPDAITGRANLLNALIFQVTGVHDMGVRFAAGAALSIPDTIVRSTYLANRDAIEVAMLRTQLLGVRIATRALMLALLILLCLVVAADGLSQRAIRRASAGRESASLYHRAKRLQVALAATGVLVGLLWPAVVDARAIAVALTAPLGVLARGHWTYCKKDL
jgi:hypothetical protein